MLEVAHVITADDVGMGVYRHPMNSPQRKLLVSISSEFGGISPADVGRKVYQTSSGRLVWEGSHPQAPVSAKFQTA